MSACQRLTCPTCFSLGFKSRILKALNGPLWPLYGVHISNVPDRERYLKPKSKGRKLQHLRYEIDFEDLLLLKQAIKKAAVYVDSLIFDHMKTLSAKADLRAIRAFADEAGKELEKAEEEFERRMEWYSSMVKRAK